MYVNHENSAICPMTCLDLYLDNKCDSLFQQPLQHPKENMWYSEQPFGKQSCWNAVYPVQLGYINGIQTTVSHQPLLQG